MPHDFHALERPRAGAPQEVRADFARRFMGVLDLCNVAPGDVFVVAHPGALFPHEVPVDPEEADARQGARMPPHVHRDQEERARAAESGTTPSQPDYGPATKPGSGFW